MERRTQRLGLLRGLLIALLAGVACQGARASESLAPVAIDIAVAGVPSMGGTVNAVLTVVPEVDCDHLQAQWDLVPGLSLAGGIPSWTGAAARGVPIRLTAAIRIAVGGIAPLGATVVARETGTSLLLTKTQNVYLDIATPGRARGGVLAQAPPPGGAELAPARPPRVTRSLSGRNGGTAALTGKFDYTDKAGATQPIAGCRVRLIEGTTELQVGTTGADGSFSFNVEPGKTYRVEIRSEATDGSRVKVVSSLPDNVHWTRWRQEVAADAAGTTIDMGQLRVASHQHTATAANYARDQSGAFAILDTVRQGQLWTQTRGGALQDANVVWYAGYNLGSSYYSSGTNAFYMRGQQNNPGQWQPSVILHEYGHFLHRNYSTSASLGGFHPTGQQDQAYAYSEGWATFTMGAVRNDPVYRSGSPGHEWSIDISTGTDGWGKQNEWDVARMLWDTLQVGGINNIWQIFTVNKPTTMQGFVNAWFYDANRPAGQKSLGNEQQLLAKYRSRRNAGRPGILNVVRIQTPASGARVHAGPFDRPKKFKSVAQLRWDDASIRRDATGFGVQIPPGVGGDSVTPVHNLTGSRYELDVRQPPRQAAEGTYDLVVSGTHEESYLVRKNSGGTLVDEAKTGPVTTAFCRELGVEYGEPGGIELALIIDSSGSMGWNDPGNYRKSASKMLVDMAEEKDAMAVVDFDSSVRTWASLTTITGKPGESTPDRNALKAAIDKVDSSGGTNIEAGLQRGYSELAASTTNAPKAAILLTDGEGTYSGVATQQFAAKGWPVYTIALTGAADEALMRSIASATGGEYAKAPTQHNLAELFARLRGAPKGESTVANTQGNVNPGETVSNEVTIDGQMEAATFSTTWSNGTMSLSLQRPDGTTVDQSEPGVTFGSAGRFAFFTIEKPMAGLWRMSVTGTNVPTGGEPFVNTVTGPSPLALTLFTIDANYLKGGTVRLALSLQDGATPVLGAAVTAAVTRPDSSQPAPARPVGGDEEALEELFSSRSGSMPSRAATVTDTVTLLDDGQHNDGSPNDGLYAADYGNTGNAGDYVVDITANGQTSGGQAFSRITRQTFTVTSTPLTGLTLNKTQHDFGSVYASGDSAAATFRVTSSLNSAEQVSVSPGDLKTADGDVLPASGVAVLPQALEVPAKSYSEFEAHIAVPAGTKAGVYTGELVVEGGGRRLTATLQVTVTTESDAPVLSGISPADGAILVNPGPQVFTVTVTDVGSGVAAHQVRMSVDGVAVPHQFDPATGVVTAVAHDNSEGADATGSQGGELPLAFRPGLHTAVFEAADVSGNTALATVRYRVVGPPPGFGRGLSMVVIPAQLSMPADANPFGAPEFRAAWYPPGGPGYILFGDPAFPGFGPQTPIWVKSVAADSNLPMAWSGTVPDQQQAQVFAVKRGWNMIAHSFVDPVAWSLQGLRVRRGSEEKTLAEAWQAGWVEDYAWSFRPDPVNPETGTYFMVYDSSVIAGVAGELAPWGGYWFKANEDCDLILPPPGQTRLRVVDRPRRATGWSVPLHVRSGAGVDQVVLGMTEGQRGLSVVQPPDPPEGSRQVRVTLLRDGRPVVVDLREGALQGRQEWEVVVTPVGRAAAEAREFTLTWPDLRGLPKDVVLTLVDEAAGARRSLRTAAAYTFQMNGDARRFRVVAQPRAGSALLITDLEIEPVRAGRAVRFALSTAAVVDLEVVSPTGRVVAVVSRAHAAQAGINRVVWSGSVSPGLYLVRATATTEEGARTQTIKPVIITR
ncbi:MAG: VWA domain-containing protein [Armatimonadetes bacterium]|nr:VWA domain-containing protein [Armatimonadota bacterium]